MSETRGTTPRNLLPGEKVAAAVPVYFGAQGWNLREPGRYAFRAEVLSSEGWRVLSDPVSVVVKAPTAEGLNEPATQMMAAPIARFMYDAGGNESAMNDLRRIARGYPDTAWARYADLALTIDAAARTSEFKDSTSCGELQKATQRMRELDWAASLRGYDALLRCYSRTGQRQQAYQTLQRLHGALPQTKAVQELRVE
jgi:hypothetical protein